MQFSTKKFMKSNEDEENDSNMWEDRTMAPKGKADLNRIFDFSDLSLVYGIMRYNTLPIYERFKDISLKYQFTKTMITELADINDIINQLSDYQIYPMAQHGDIKGNAICLSAEDSLYVISLDNRGHFRSIRIQAYCARYDESLLETLVTKFAAPHTSNIVTANITWYFISRDGTRYNEVTEILDDNIYPEAYPFIKDMEAFLKGYTNSKEPVLLLIGPPGTGKTRLIRYMLKYFGQQSSSTVNICYATDPQVLDQDAMFIDFLTEDKQAMVLEDMDENLTSRSSGNTVMYKLLTASDGLLTNQNKKMIFSTNKDLLEVDSALRRPGRCYKIIETRALDREESIKFLTVIAKDLNDNTIIERFANTKGDSFYLAQLYRIVRNQDPFNEEVGRTVGFQ